MKRQKTMVLTGGGSGGHVTPLLAVAEVLRKDSPDYKLVYVGQKNDPMVDHMTKNQLFDHVYMVRAGKLRRYHGEGLKQLLDIPTVAKNIRDLFYVVIGFVQSLILLSRLKPSVLFCKGGYVGVPLGLSAALLRIPYVTHDSDGVPGLANRIIAKWAAVHAVALPKETYTYPAHKTVTVGVPIQSAFKKVSEQAQIDARQKIGLAKTYPVLLVIGGGLGAAAINREVMDIAKDLLTKHHTLSLLHVTGQRSEQQARSHYQSLPEAIQKRIHVYGFTHDVATLGAAATIIVTRAGATNLAEFALQAKPCIVIPHPHLTGGHQLKNAKVYADKGAALVVEEGNIHKLQEAVTLLLANPEKQLGMSSKISELAVPKAAEALAGVLMTVAHRREE